MGSAVSPASHPAGGETKKGTERVTYRVKLTTRMEKAIEKELFGIINKFCS